MATIKQFHTLLSISGMSKEDILNQYGVQSSKELTQEELSDAVNKLNIMLNNNEEYLRGLRSDVLTLATKLGIKKVDSWEEFNSWMLNRSTAKKPLPKCSVEELKMLLRQLYSWKSKQNKKKESDVAKKFINKYGIKAEA